MTREVLENDQKSNEKTMDVGNIHGHRYELKEL